MKVLDLFCGMGGWSIGFHREGFTCYGLDEVDVGYPYELWQTPIEELRGGEYRDMGFDVVVASPPCIEFSQLNYHPNIIKNRGPPNIEKGLSLVKEAKRVIDLVEPRYWCIENVRGALKHFYPILGKPACRYGPWQLWGNFPASLIPDGIRKWEGTGSWLNRSARHDPLASWKRAKIPLPLSLALARACKDAIIT